MKKQIIKDNVQTKVEMVIYLFLINFLFAGKCVLRISRVFLEKFIDSIEKTKSAGTSSSRPTVIVSPSKKESLEKEESSEEDQSPKKDPSSSSKRF